MDTGITLCIHINFRFFPLKTGQEYLACTETFGFSYLVPLIPPLLPITFALKHIFTSYKDCLTWLCRSHMNVRLNLSPMGDAGSGDGHKNHIMCPYELPFL